MSRLSAVRRWSLAGVGFALASVSLLAALLDGEAFVVDLAERSVPIAVGLGLVAGNGWLRRQNLSGENVSIVAVSTVATAAVSALFESWMLFLVSLESPLPEEVDYLVLNAVALGVVAGSAIGYQYVRLRDETREQTRLAAEMRRTNERLETEVERLDEFASVVSHDLRNPLGVATAYLSLVQETGERRHLGTVEDALDRAEAITAEMLELARQGQAVNDPKPVELEATARLAWRTVETGDAALEVSTEALVTADESRLRQLFENLFRNAVEHGGPGLTTVRIGTREGGFYVGDDGAGVDPSAIDDVFSSGYTTTAGNTGYGLAIVESIADAHGWTVSVADADDGARFEFDGVELRRRVVA
jgi:signal transduction histidine kinase